MLTQVMCQTSNGNIGNVHGDPNMTFHEVDVEILVHHQAVLEEAVEHVVIAEACGRFLFHQNVPAGVRED